MKIQDYILDSTDQLIESNSTTTTTTTSSKKPSVNYEIEDFGSGDFVVSRTTPRTSRSLVWLTTQNQMYFKDNRTRTIKPWSKQEHGRFFREAVDTNGNDLVFSTSLFEPTSLRDKNVVSDLQELYNTFRSDTFNSSEDSNQKSIPEVLQYWIKRGLCKFNFDPSCKSIYHCMDLSYLNPYHETLKSVIPILQPYFSQDSLARFIGQTLSCYSGISARGPFAIYSEATSLPLTPQLSYDLLIYYHVFGTAGIRYFLNLLLTNPQFSTTECRYNSFPFNNSFEYTYCDGFLDEDFISFLSTYNFSYKAFFNYFYFQRYREGGRAIRHWVNLWGDCLSMQQQLYGHVRHKYPKNLETYHNQLSFQVSLHRAEIEESLFQSRKQDLASFEDTIDSYFIRAPKSQDDLLHEATQQCNCLASYTSIYAQGKTDLFFLRKQADPDTSLITIEVRDHKLRQAYRASNQEPSPEEWQIISTWCLRHSIECSSNTVPLGA